MRSPSSTMRSTRPWTVTKKYVRETSPNIIWHFNDCAENNQQVTIGKEKLHGERRRHVDARQERATAAGSTLFQIV